VQTSFGLRTCVVFRCRRRRRCRRRCRVRHRALHLRVAHLARADGADALDRDVAAEVKALRGEVAIELVERRQRGDGPLGQLGRQQLARRVVFGLLGLASKERVEGAERVEAHEKRPATTAGLLSGLLHARRAPRSRSTAGNAVMAADSSIGRTCSVSAFATSSGNCRCADTKLESAPELAHAASVAATSIGRPSGLVRGGS